MGQKARYMTLVQRVMGRHCGDLTPEQRLWRQVLVQAFDDIIKPEHSDACKRFFWGEAGEEAAEYADIDIEVLRDYVSAFLHATEQARARDPARRIPPGARYPTLRLSRRARATRR